MNDHKLNIPTVTQYGTMWYNKVVRDISITQF